jgi:hypothetical protein
MASQEQGGGNPLINTNSFTKGMVKDYNESFVGEGLYTHARNAVNNSYEGNVGVIGNEPSNLFCVKLPYTYIGSIYTDDDKWVVFTTNNIKSEIGIFDESECSYTKIINSDCLNFKTTNLITGVFRNRFDCDRMIYWDDGLNPTRSLNIDKIPFKYTEKLVNGCIIKEYTKELDCEAIRIVSLIKHPCIEIKAGNIAGTLPNGSYQACIAYTINQVKITDYIGLSEVQGLFTHQNVSSSFIIEIKDIDETFDEFELVIVANINQQSLAKRIGYYSTSQGRIYVDRWDPEYVSVPVSDVVFRSQPIEKTDAMFSVNNYLLRVGAYSKFKFNYQQQANQIKTSWVAVEYPASYYVKGGNNTGYLRDEQYSFFIRWIYNTGERSDSYHIPGRISTSSDRAFVTNDDSFENANGVQVRRWQMYNTASIESLLSYKLSDGGKVIGSGRMGYWESTERYPADRPDIWGDLCGKPIRHHKFPDVTVSPLLNHFGNLGNTITTLGVQFENISHPLDLDGNPIESIVGYEILRGSREGNKSIISKGLLNNMREYRVVESPDIKGLYQNYPYNDLRADPYITEVEQDGKNGPKNDKPNTPKSTKYRKDAFSFHGPEVAFSNPFLNASELKIYQELSGEAKGSFQVPYQHPKFKQVTNGLDLALDVFATAVSVIQAAAAVAGGLTYQIGSDPNLPQQTLGITKVMAEGLSGSIGTIATGIAVGANATFVAAYTVLFGVKVYKQQALSMALALMPFRQFAAQYNSHGFYSVSQANRQGNMRREIVDSRYVDSSIQQFTSEYQVNNINRSRFVVLQLGQEVENPISAVDNSRFTIGESGTDYNKPLSSTICSYYGALKLSIPSQYGQLESVEQLPISTCIEPSTASTTTRLKSAVLFGGDTYINRFTEKNTMFFFTTWMQGEPDGSEFNYTLYPAVPYPRYWINNQKYIGLFAEKASELRSLDKVDKSGFFYLNKGYFYLFNSGVRDFFVESEINLAYRDWEDSINTRHYDVNSFTDLSAMFRSDIIVAGNYYKYDYSLSVSKLFNNNISWGSLLPRDYNPIVESKCYVYSPNRVIYSLPQQEESKKDNWSVFLTNNYKEFPTPVTSIKPVNKTGALFMMKNGSPLQFLGVEELKLDGTNTKVTIGDGGLFTGPQQLQAIVNADQPYEYGSCQNRASAIGTRKGIFWVSQNQGKIFQYVGQLNEISNSGLKWWFAKYLPSRLLEKFSNYKYFDNPVEGIGVQCIYDNVNEVFYITKKDYLPIVDGITLSDDGTTFLFNNTKISLKNTTYFEDVSWTASYDTKSQAWVSFHDWKPVGLLPSKTHFMSVDINSIWKHNVRCDNYCNFYNKDYPFEIEFISSTGQTITSVRNIEYMLEVYNYYNDCRDRFHVLDQNFDQAIIYNSEQISGLLNLILKPKNNPLALVSQPTINFDSIDIYFSKEEQKYRFNQFWDITKNRGEFSSTGVAPMFVTKGNGYEYPINSNYVNYNKNPIERKKFRHNINRVFLRKTTSGKNKMLFKLSNEKLLISNR